MLTEKLEYGFLEQQKETLLHNIKQISRIELYCDEIQLRKKNNHLVEVNEEYLKYN